MPSTTLDSRRVENEVSMEMREKTELLRMVHRRKGEKESICLNRVSYK